ncbi:MAG TPA: short-chain dehydrogenase/reductase, partial [Arthrobacter bacterium]|nr:short-chain dehydrogenase/reductase [Arthrobacter sp.]
LGAWYHATKFAVEGMSDALRLELKPHGIEVAIIEPASTVSEWGRISAEGLLASSGDGPYAAQARHMADVLASTDRTGTSTQPAVIAAAVLHAASAARPRTRYPVGRGAAAIVGLRRVLPDRLYDAVVMAVLKRVAS